jgi:large subunit ribosomal protein L25
MKKENPKLKAEKRVITGKKVKQLRKQGILPSTVYGQEMEPLTIQVNEKEVDEIFSRIGESGLVDLIIDEKVMPVLFRNPQFHPVIGNLLHIDCYKVNLKEKITSVVPLEFVGESEAVKAGNILVTVLNEVEIEALPADFPEKIDVDLSKLVDLESMITVADLDVDKKILELKTDTDQVIVKVEEPKAEEEPVAAEEETPGEVPATEQKPSEDKAEEKDEKKE